MSSLHLGVNEFVAYVIETERKQIYVFGHEELNPKLIDSGIIGSGDFNITPVVRRQQVGKISISQAYLNVRLMLWARQVFQDYQVAFYHPIASDSNHNTMVGVKQKPREMNHKVCRTTFFCIFLHFYFFELNFCRSVRPVKGKKS